MCPAGGLRPVAHQCSAAGLPSEFTCVGTGLWCALGRERGGGASVRGSPACAASPQPLGPWAAPSILFFFAYGAGISFSFSGQYLLRALALEFVIKRVKDQGSGSRKQLAVVEHEGLGGLD